MNIIVWENFSKRRNSTKQPNSNDGTTVSVKLKDNCSIDNPSFIVSADYKDVNYIKAFNRFYYVTGCTFLNNTMIELACSKDRMATFKTAIGNTSTYVLYDTAANSKGLKDERLNVSTDYTVGSATSTFMNDTVSSSGSYIMTYTGTHGSGVTVVVDPNTIIPSDAQINARWDEIISSSEDLGDKLASCIKWLTGSGTAAQNIQSMIWVPFNVGAEATGQYIHLGVFNIGQTINRIPNRFVYYTDTVNIPWVYSDYRKNFSTIYLTVPFLGTMNWPGETLKGSDSFNITSCLDRYTGEVTLSIHANGFGALYTTTINTSATIPMGMANGFNRARFFNTLIGGSIAALTTIGGGAASSLSSANNVLAHADIKTATTGFGAYSGATGSRVETEIVCKVIAHDTSDTPASINATMGSPTYAIKKISNVPGYIQTLNVAIDLPGFESDASEINSIMNSGFYYE